MYNLYKILDSASILAWITAQKNVQKKQMAYFQLLNKKVLTILTSVLDLPRKCAQIFSINSIFEQD